MSIIACAGPEEDGANFTPPTLGQFLDDQKRANVRLREARAGAQVIREAREFHLKQSSRYGINTNRGLAHFRASKMYTREGNRLQEMFENGGDELGELPPKAIMKANKAAMIFHKKQADKAGLDSDLGHAHVAAMEHHADILKKAKDQLGQQKQPQQSQPMKQSKREALPGHGSKVSPVPVPKKSEQPNEDIQDPNKPPVTLNPQDANKQPRRLQQNEADEGGPGSGPRKGFGGTRKENSAFNKLQKKMSPGLRKKIGKGFNDVDKKSSSEPKDYKRGDLVQHSSGKVGEVKGYKGDNVRVGGEDGKSYLWKEKDLAPADDLAFGDGEESARESRRRAIANFGREANVKRRLNSDMDDTFPRGAGRQVDPDLVFRGPRTKESRRRRSLRRS